MNEFIYIMVDVLHDKKKRQGLSRPNQLYHRRNASSRPTAKLPLQYFKK